MLTRRRRMFVALCLGACALVGLASWAGEASGVAFVHVASLENTTGNRTTIEDPTYSGMRDACVLVTQSLSPEGGMGVRNNHPVGVSYRDGRWSIANMDGAPIPLGAAFNVHVLSPEEAGAQRHTANVGNIGWGNSTSITAVATDNNPNALVFVTPCSLDAERREEAHYVGVWYWDSQTLVYYEDRADMPVGATFSIESYNGSEDSVFLHTTTLANMPQAAGDASDYTWIDDARTNGDPYAILLLTHNWNPGGNGGTYVAGALAVRYDAQAAKWAIVNESGPMPVGAAFNVLVLAGSEAARAEGAPETSGSDSVAFAELQEGSAVGTVIADNGLPQATTRVRWTGEATIGVPVALDADGLQVAVYERGMTPDLHECDLVWHPWHGNGEYVLLLQLADFNTGTTIASQTVRVRVTDIPAGTPTVRERIIELYRRRFAIEVPAPVFGRYNKPIPEAANPSIWVSAAYIGNRFYSVGLRDSGEELADTFGVNSGEPSVGRPLGHYDMLVVAGRVSATNVEAADVVSELASALSAANEHWASASAALGQEPLLSLALDTVFVDEPLYPDRWLSAAEVRTLSHRSPWDYDVIVQLTFDPSAASVGGTVFNCCVPGGPPAVTIRFNVADSADLASMASAVLEHEFIHDLGWMHWWPEGDGSTRARMAERGARLPSMMFGWVDSDGDGILEIQDPTPYGRTR